MDDLPFDSGLGPLKSAVIAIGGAEDQVGAMEVLKGVLAAADRTRVHVITTATSYPAEARKRYEKVFKALQVESCAITHIDTRAQANDVALAQTVGAADIIFFSGGDQLKLTHILGGTATMDAIRRAHERGAVIAGTSAGAAAQSALMIYGGSSERELYKGKVKAAAGFGFLRDCVIDTHFSQRQRLPRLFQLAAANPGLLGIGLDEDTAIVRDGQSPVLKVIGSGIVTIVDAVNCESNIADRAMGERFDASGFIVYRLSAGEKFDLETRTKLPVIAAPKPPRP